MKKITRIWQLLLVLVLATSIVSAQADYKGKVQKKKLQFKRLHSVSNVKSEAVAFEAQLTKESYAENQKAIFNTSGTVTSYNPNAPVDVNSSIAREIKNKLANKGMLTSYEQQAIEKYQKENVAINSQTSNKGTVVDLYPSSTAYWTGTTDGTTKTENSLVNLNGNSYAGWMQFDVSSIPVGSAINEVNITVYVNATNWPYWAITKMTTDPLVDDAATLFSDIQGGDQYVYNTESSGFSTGWHTYTLGGDVLTDFANALASGIFRTGMFDVDNGTNYYVDMDGWNEANVPYLTVDYTPAVVGPGLTNGMVDSPSGNTTTLFTYSVEYSHSDGTAPTVANVVIDGASFAMTPPAGSPDYHNWQTFTYSTTLALGTHDFYFEFGDGTTTVVDPITAPGTPYTGPTVYDPISGTLTINAAGGGDYLSFQDCFDDLLLRGTDGNGVSVEVYDDGGDYAAATIDGAIPGAGSGAWVDFYPAAGENVVIDAAGTGEPLYLQNTAYLSFSGFALTNGENAGARIYASSFIEISHCTAYDNGWIGIGATDSDHVWVWNNFIYHNVTQQLTAYDCGTGCEVYFYNNSIAANGTSDAYQIGVTISNSEIDLYNNTIQRSWTDSGWSIVHIQSQNWTTHPNTNMDYNNYYQTDGCPIVGFNDPASSYTTYATLVDWQAATPAQDPNSVEGNPSFLDVSNGDLHIIDDLSPSYQTGTTIAMVTDDIDGDLRTINPNYDMGADVIVPPACPNPANLTTSNINEHDATLEWASLGSAFEYEYGTPGFAPGTGNEIGSGAPHATSDIISGLNSNTEYEWYVRQDCGGGLYSDWSGPASFTTKCEIIIPAGAVEEAEVCGDDTNGGCNMATPAYESVVDGEVLHGTTWSDASSRDTDWFELVLDQPATVTMTLEGEAPMVMGMIEQYVLGCPGCDNMTGSLEPSVIVDKCGFDSFTTQGLPAGTYYFFVAPSVFEDYPCTVDYVASWTTAAYTPAAGEFCSTAIVANTGINNAPQQPVWYSYVGVGQYVTVTSCISGQDIDTELTIYDDCCGNTVAYNDDDSGCASSGFSSTVEFFAESGVTYYLYWSDAYESGSFDFEIIEEGLPIISLDKSSLYQAVLPGGTATENLMVGNFGDHDLTYTATINYPAPPAGTTILFEDFEAGMPPSWSIIDNETNGYVWILESDNTDPKGNKTGGTGDCAIADVDALGSGNTMDTELHTASFDLSGFVDAQLVFKAAYNDLNSGGNDLGEVDISIDGGNSWDNLISWDEDHMGEDIVVSLLPYVGNPDCIISFHYIATGWQWYFEVDDVEVIGYNELIPPEGWLAVDGDVTTNGVVAAGAADAPIVVDYNSAGLPNGTYHADIVVESNDPFNTPITVPVTFVVSDHHTVSGTLVYASSTPQAMDNCTINLLRDGNVVGTAVTNASGEFSIADVFDGTYEWEFTTNKARGGTDVGDVNVASDHILGNALIGLFFVAADVTWDNTVDVSDVNNLLDEILGSPGWAAPDFVTDGGTIVVDGGDVSVTLETLSSGDPDPSYSIPAGK